MTKQALQDLAHIWRRPRRLHPSVFKSGPLSIGIPWLHDSIIAAVIGLKDLGRKCKGIIQIAPSLFLVMEIRGQGVGRWG